MTRLRRRPRPPADLSELTYGELCRLATLGRITWAQVSDITREAVLDMTGGVEPYAHLRPKS